MTSASDEKWRPFNCFISLVGLRTCQHPCVGSCHRWDKNFFKRWTAHPIVFGSNQHPTHTLSPYNAIRFVIGYTHMLCCGPGSVDDIATGRSGDRIPVGTRFFVPVQTGTGVHPASCTMGTGSFPGVKSGRGVTLTPHPLLVPWSWKGSAIPLLPLWAVRPVQNLSARTRATFTFFYVLCCRHTVFVAVTFLNVVSFQGYTGGRF